MFMNKIIIQNKSLKLTWIKYYLCIHQQVVQHVQPPQPLNQVHPRYLADLEDGEDTSQDAADLVSSHDEVKPAGQNQEQQHDLCKEEKEIEEPIMKVNEPVVAAPKPRSRLALPKTPAKTKDPTEKIPEVTKPEVAKPEVAKTEVDKSEVAKPEIGHPDKSFNPVSASKQQISKTTDEDFMMESDNIDENLYSSESDSTTSSGSTDTSTSEDKKTKKGQAVPVKPLQQQKMRFSSSSSNNSLHEKKASVQPRPMQPSVKQEAGKPVQAINLESDSDSPEIKQPQPRSGGVSNLTFPIPAGNDADLEISGPENELDDDDFWNWNYSLQTIPF